MATGALNNSAGDIALAVTGIAGPDGGSRKTRRIGLFGLGYSMIFLSLKKQFSGNRQEIRLQACYEALEGLLDWI